MHNTAIPPSGDTDIHIGAKCANNIPSPCYQELNKMMKKIDMGHLAPIYTHAVDRMMPVIEELLGRYEGWFKRDYCEELDNPEAALRKFICEFDEYYPANLEPMRYRLALRTFILDLECWYYRTNAVDANERVVEVWQPLQETYHEFVRRHQVVGHKVKHGGNYDERYPSGDMILSWINTTLKTKGIPLIQDD